MCNEEKGVRFGETKGKDKEGGEEERYKERKR